MLAFYIAFGCVNFNHGVIPYLFQDSLFVCDLRLAWGLRCSVRDRRLRPFGELRRQLHPRNSVLARAFTESRSSAEGHRTSPSAQVRVGFIYPFTSLPDKHVQSSILKHYCLSLDCLAFQNERTVLASQLRWE